MRRVIFSLSLAFMLLASIASCSHRSGVPFLDRLGINTDSVLFDSLPNDFYSSEIGNFIPQDKCDSLHTYFNGNTKLVSIKQFGENYFLTFLSRGEGMYSILYDKNGNVLDEVHQHSFSYRARVHKDSLDRGLIHNIIGPTKAPGAVAFYDFTWERHFVDDDKFVVTGRIGETDSIVKYSYLVSDNKITQTGKIATNGMQTYYMDIKSLPASQAYQACNLMGENPKKKPYCPPGYYMTFSIGAILYTRELEPFLYYNAPEVLKWISDHREDGRMFDALDWIKGDIEDGSLPFPKDFLNKHIMKMKDKDARDFILNGFAEREAKRETY